ncbi:MAG: glycosyltransferase family 61 protein [Gammaproteobacteria bacterium]|nr:glycosyltransferase family 61 protein [Gammaproteobacteria bacterium]
MADKSSRSIIREEAFEVVHELPEVLACQDELLKKSKNLLHEENLVAWIPPVESGDGIVNVRVSSRSSKIECIPPRPKGNPGVVFYIFRAFYRRHLKQYGIMRQVTQWTWRKAYTVYLNYINVHFFNRKEKIWRPLINLSAFVEKNLIPVCKLAEAAIVETPKPKVYPSCEQGFLISPHDRYTFPEIFVAIIKKTMIYGGTNMVLVDGNVVCHDLYDFERDSTSEELHGRILIDPKYCRIRWLSHDEEPESIAEAATFVDACAANYAHWMTEVMPRVVLFCADERFKGVPIVVNEGLHQNIMNSLFMVVGADREIVTLPIGRALTVGKLYLTSATGYVPFERRSNKLSDHSHGVFSPRAFEVLVQHLSELGRNIKDNAWPEKIFLRRNSEVRKITNVIELEKFLVTRGYVIVEPEKLTFTQQVKLFSNAKIIVGSAGAAWINMLFAPHDAKIFILISKNPATSYWYWQNIACASGKTVNYVLGKINSSRSSGVHADFMIDLESFSQALDEELILEQPIKRKDNEN